MKAEQAAPCLTQFRTGMAMAVMNEIADCLETLATKGESTAIDLRGLPMTAADRSELEQRLGRGEVVATLNVVGTTEVWETGYSGVWWIRHLGADGQVVSEEISCTPIPGILHSQAEDINEAAGRIRNDLDTAGRSDSIEEAAHG